MNWVSNIWQHPKTSAAGVLIAIVTVCGVLTQQGITLGNIGTGNVVALISALATSLLGLLARDPSGSASSTSGSTSTTSAVGILLLAGMALTFAPVARAADSTATASTSSTLTLSASSDVLADHCNGGWTTGTHVAESLDFYDTGNTHVYLEGHEHISTGCGFSVYAGGVGVQPDLSKLLKKTNISTDNLSVAFHVAMGNGLPTSGSGSHISALVGGVVKYRATTSLSWNALQVQWVRYGSTNVAAISTGFSYVFGQ